MLVHLAGKLHPFYYRAQIVSISIIPFIEIMKVNGRRVARIVAAQFYFSRGVVGTCLQDRPGEPIPIPLCNLGITRVIAFEVSGKAEDE
jgi:hypothetical protein